MVLRSETAKHPAVRVDSGAVVRGVLFGLSVLTALLFLSYQPFGWDARAFYDPRYIADDTAYVWSPAFARLTTPLRLLPFDAFLMLVRGAELAALLVLAPLGAWLALFLPPVASEVHSGNINLILAACIAFGFRWPVLWTLPLLTKPTLGVGLLWFVVRREWRALAWGILPAAAISLVSFAADPEQWWAWLTFLTTLPQDGGWPFPYPLWVRLPIAVVLVVYGARTDRAWAAALGAIIAMPRLYFMTPAMLLALLPLSSSPARGWQTFRRR